MLSLCLVFAIAARQGRRGALKPNGWVVVHEYTEEKADEHPVAGLYRMSLPQLRAEIESRDFQLGRIRSSLPVQHSLVFNKKR